MNATRPSRGPPDAVIATAPFAARQRGASIGVRLTADLERVLDRVADDRTGHAVAAAAAATQFRPDDGDDLDPGPAQQRIGMGVAVVGEDDSRFDGDEVVATVPLLTLVVVLGSARLHHPQFRQ